jgi:molecular chaperone GrpE
MIAGGFGHRTGPAGGGTVCLTGPAAPSGLIFCARALICEANRFASGNNVMMDTARPYVDADREPETAATSGPEEEARIAALVEALSKEVSDYKDKHLRTLAEMENLRRRTAREVTDSRIYSVTNFARDILAVADNMARSVSALTAELQANADERLKALLDGVELTERELIKALEKHGVKKFDPKGEKFDPNLHQAMFEVPDPSLPAGTVAQVVQSGYMIGERVLRPALVGVAKGGPKSPASDAPANDNASVIPEGPQGSR